jgi:thermitase
MEFIGLSIIFLALWIFMEKKAKWSLLWRALLYISILGVILLPFFNPLLLFKGLPFYLLSAILYIAATGYLLLSNKDSKLLQVFYLLLMLSFLPYVLKLPLIKKNDFPIFEQGEYLIHTDEGNVSSLEKDYGVELKRIAFPKDGLATNIDNVYTIDIDASVSVESFFQKLKKDGRIRWIEYNDLYKLKPLQVEAPVSREMRGTPLLNDPRIKEQWAYSFLKMDAFHDYLQRNKIRPKRKARLFILDTGIESNHEDLKASYLSADKESDADPRGHGTHCAGIAAGISNNGLGIASLNPGVDWMDISSIKVISRLGFAPQSKVIEGIIEATDKGADVISLSLGGRSNDLAQEAYDEAVEYALNKGVIVVASAGNSNLSAALFSPANSKGVIAVSALNSSGEKAYFSNTVDEVERGIAAPGESILSTDINNTYSVKSGTSMAGPMVAGLAAMAKSLDPNISPEQFYDLLYQSGIQGRDSDVMGRTMNPLALLKKMN